MKAMNDVRVANQTQILMHWTYALSVVRVGIALMMMKGSFNMLERLILLS